MNYCTNNLLSFPGAFNTTGDDTLGCRLYHQTAVPVVGTVHCLHASPAGDNTCGAWCDVYCDLIMKNCFGNNVQYNSMTECKTQCAGMSNTGDNTATTGDTVQCRIYHAGVAGNPLTNAPVHCIHAGKNGGGQCGGTAATTGAVATTGTGAASVVAASFALMATLIAALL